MFRSLSTISVGKFTGFQSSKRANFNGWIRNLSPSHSREIGVQYSRMRINGPLAIVVAALGAIALLGCARKVEQQAPSKANTPQRGDRVLVESSAAQFYEARVLNVEHSKLRVQALPSGDAALVEVADAYRLPSKVTPLAAASLAICNGPGERWFGCRVVKSDPEGADVTDVNELTQRLAWSQIMPPNALTELNLKRLFDKAGEQHDFEHDLAHAGAPKSIPGWRASAGKAVLARVDGKWWTAAISSEKRGKVRIRFAGSERQAEVDHAELAPEPPYPMEISQRSRFALVRPTNPNQPWNPVRLVSVDALEAVVEGIGSKRRTVPVRDLCPLETTIPTRNP